jgi:ankyrin repeat protein
VRLLCEHGANVNSKNSNGCTPLHIAAFYGHVSVVKCLSELGAKIDEKNNDGATPFFIGIFLNLSFVLSSIFSHF